MSEEKSDEQRLNDHEQRIGIMREQQGDIAEEQCRVASEYLPPGWRSLVRSSQRHNSSDDSVTKNKDCG